jgi:GT2 family glycosyltransferase
MGSTNYDSASVTVIVPTTNRGGTFFQTMESVNMDRVGEVIVVDDSADDRIYQWCENHSVTYCDGPGVNLPMARNRGIREASTDIVTFIDDDVTLPPGFVDNVADAFNRFPDAVAIGGPALSKNVRSARNRCYRELMRVNSLTGTVHDDSYRWVPETPQQVGLLKGANMSFRRDVLEAIGGFDTRYKDSCQREETDVCVRIARHGDIMYDPLLQCHHEQVGNLKGDESHIYSRFYNHGYFVKKNFGSATFVLGLLSIVFRVCGNPDSFLQLGYRKFVLDEGINIVECVQSYIHGGLSYGQESADTRYEEAPLVSNSEE